MSKFGFGGAQRVKNFSDIDKLYWDKVGQRNRFLLFTGDMVQKWTHYIKMGEKGRYYECLGDETVLSDTLRDTDHCPACAQADPNTKDAAVPMPRRRIAMDVLRYITDSDGKPIKPTTLVLQAWVFGPDKLNALIDLREEYGDILGKDIVGKCKNKDFQQLDFVLNPNKSYWESSAEAKVIVKEAIEAAAKEIPPTHSTSELERLLCSPMTAESYRRLFDDAPPPLDDDDVDEEIDKASAMYNLRGEGLTDEALAEDDEEETPTTSSFAALLAGSRKS